MAGSISDEERRWTVVGVCLTKVLTPSLRSVLPTELQNWYHCLCQPPDEIDKQVFPKYKKKLPPSKFQLKYENINNNEVHKSSSAYDYAVKDPLSLAKLFLQPFMAMFTGFDQTMDMSAVLTVMCEADPFVTSGAAVCAKTVRSDIRNKWAHCNFSEWNEPTFIHAFKDMENLAKKINLSPDDEKTLCDDLDGWKKAGLELCFGQPVNSDLLKLVTEEVVELRTSVRTWKFESDTQMNTVLEKLHNIESNLVCRIEKLETHAAEGLKELKRHSEEIERLKQKENYSEFADKKVPYGLRNLPREMVERPSEVNEILGLLKKGNNRVGVVESRSGDVFGIRGMGGLDDKKMCDEYDFTTTAETSGGEEIFSHQMSKRKEVSSCSAVVLPTPPRRYVESTPKTKRNRFSPRKLATAGKKTCPPKQKRQRSKSRSRSRSPLLTRSPTLQLGSSRTGRLSRSPSPRSNSSRSPSRSPTPPPRRSPKRQKSSSASSKSSESSSQSRLVGQRKELSREERGAYQQSLVECFTSLDPERNREKSSANQFPMPEGRFQKRVLHLLMEIRDSVKQVGKRCEPAESDFHIDQATSVDEIKRLEETLLDEETRKLLTTRLGKVSGSTIKDNVRGIMNRECTKASPRNRR